MSNLKISKDLLDALKKNEERSEIPNGFYAPRDFDDEVENKKDYTSLKEEIDDYLLTVVSGERTPSENICESGSTLVKYDKLKEMVDNNYNIISAKYLGDDLISIRYDKEIDKRGMSR